MVSLMNFIVGQVQDYLFQNTQVKKNENYRIGSSEEACSAKYKEKIK